MKIGISTLVDRRVSPDAPAHVVRLVRALVPYARREHRVTLFVRERDRELYRFAQDIMNIARVPDRFDGVLKSFFWHQRQLPQLARKWELDVLHMPACECMVWVRPCALVTTIRDLGPLRAQGPRERKHPLCNRRLAGVLARRQHEIIVPTETAAADARRLLGVSAQQVTVIPPGIDRARFCPPASPAEAAAAVAARHGLREPYFLCVADSDDPAANHARLIQAFNRFKAHTRSPWQLVFAGADDESIRSARLLSAYFNDVHCLGAVDDGDLTLLYQAAGALVHPSLDGGFRFPALEAMACGRPLICSRRGVLAEIVGESAATADPEDVGAWSEQMARVATAPDARRMWGSASLARAARFDASRAAALTTKIYHRALDRFHGEPVAPTLEDGLSPPLPV